MSASWQVASDHFRPIADVRWARLRFSMALVSQSAAAIFRTAGWFVGRRADVDPAVPRQHPSYEILTEFGGLRLVAPSPRSVSLRFGRVSDGIVMVRAWERALVTTMVGIAEVDDGHAELYLTERGQVIGCSLVHDAFWLVGETFSAAMDEICAGKRHRPMLLPDQQEVWLYGDRFRRGDAGVVEPYDLS